MHIKFPYSDDSVKKIRTIPGRIWNSQTRVWELPDTALSFFLAESLGFGVFPNPIETLSVSAHSYDSAIAPFAHQQIMTSVMLSALSKNRGYGIFAETGTGKTKAVIDTIANTTSRPVLIVCPSPLLNVWLRESGKHGLNLHLAHGRYRHYNESVVLTTYDTLAIDVLSRKQVMPKFEIVFLDESQLVKSHTSKRHKAVAKLSCKCVFLLTGTPYGNSWRDVWAQTHLVAPNLIGNSSAFYDRYCLFGHFGEISGYRNLDEFKRLISLVSMSIRKADCLDLPPKIFQSIELEMAEVQKKVYRRLKEGGFENEPVASILQRISMMRQCSSGFVYAGGESFPDPKLEYLKSVSWDTPTIIWTNFVQEARRIAETLSDKTPLTADADHPADKAVENFNAGKSDILIANYASVQYGFTINRASRVIFYSPPLSQLQRTQAEDRCHRIGQTNSVLYIDLIVSPIERYILKLLKSHAAIKDHLLDIFKRKELSEI